MTLNNKHGSFTSMHVKCAVFGALVCLSLICRAISNSKKMNVHRKDFKFLISQNAINLFYICIYIDIYVYSIHCLYAHI